jgi:hypothetical protein
MKTFDYSKFPCEFDIENEDVFSVERHPEVRSWGKLIEPAQTVIGFYGKWHAGLKEWHLICSEGQHQDFVTRFRRKLKLPPFGNTGA